MSLVTRAMNMITKPKEEWQVIAAEQPDQGSILTGYALPLALIPAIATFIGFGVIGVGGVHLMGWGIGQGVMSLIATLVSLFIGAIVVNALAPTFNSRQDAGRAFQLVAYSQTPAWIAGILGIIPGLSFLSWIGSLYSIYLLYLGLPIIMETPEDKRIIYMVASFVVIAVIYFVIFSVLASIILGMFGLTALGAAAALSH